LTPVAASTCTPLVVFDSDTFHDCRLQTRKHDAQYLTIRSHSVAGTLRGHPPSRESCPSEYWTSAGHYDAKLNGSRMT
jgi:hypothetical protein